MNDKTNCLSLQHYGLITIVSTNQLYFSVRNLLPRFHNYVYNKK